MPPKKGAKAKATPAKAAAVAEPPATVTTSRGKDIETTAAAGRARRSTAATASAPPATEAKKATTTKKTAMTAAPASATTGKKRGRPAKAAATTDDAQDEAEDDAPEPPKKRGRTAKAAPAPAVLDEAPAPKKRGRPPKGGETTKISADDEAAAEQLEEELVDRVEAEGEADGAADAPSKQAPAPKKRGRPAKAAKGKGKTAAAAVVEDEAVDAPEAVEGDGVKHYWLMKAEQEGHDETLKDGSIFNTKFTIDDLRAKGGPEPWDGVRNPTACKNMKEMKVGDLAFFYASGEGKGRKKPGIVGIMEVVKEAEPDMSAFDENSAGYVENAKTRGTEEKPRWFMVHVEFRKKLLQPITRAELQKYTHGEGVLSKMQEFTAARLSVSKVTEKEWTFIMEHLIDGYEEEEAVTNDVVDKADVNVAMTDGEDHALSQVDGAIPEIKQTIESEPLTTDNLLAVDTTTTSSRPPSRAGSKKLRSRAGSAQPQANRAGSRAGSLAPSAAPRARSRTPASRKGSVQPPTTAATADDTTSGTMETIGK